MNIPLILYGDVSMDKYINVNVDKLANIYFEGNVISRNIFLEDGSKKHWELCCLGNMNLIQMQEN